MYASLGPEVTVVLVATLACRQDSSRRSAIRAEGAPIRHVTRFMLLAIFSFASACATPPPATDSTSHQHLGFEFPDRVGPFNLTRFHVYEDPLLGAIANYSIPSNDLVKVSLYIFPAPEYPDGSVQPVAEHARDELMGLLQHYDGARQI